MPVKVLLQDVRKSKGISQNELARLTKMSPQNIQKIEQGDAKSLTFKTLGKFCQALECQPGDLLVYENDTQLDTHPNSDQKKPRVSKSEKEYTHNKTLGFSPNCLIPQMISEVILLG